MTITLPQHLVTLLVGGSLCMAVVGVFAFYLAATEQKGAEAFVATVATFAAFYGVGWLVLRFL